MKNNAIITVIALIIILASLYAGFVIQTMPSEPNNNAHLFSIITAIFAGLAFAGIIITLLLQWNELKEQRKELSLARQAFTQLQNAPANSSASNLQSFETTFFTLINLIKKSRTAITRKKQKSDESVNNYIKTMNDFASTDLNPETCGKDCHLEKLNKKHSELSKKFKNIESHLKTIFVTISKIKQSDLGENADFYLELLRSQLTKPELIMLFFNCLLAEPKDGRKDLFIATQLLRYIDKNLLPEILIELWNHKNPDNPINETKAS